MLKINEKLMKYHHSSLSFSSFSRSSYNCLISSFKGIIYKNVKGMKLVISPIAHRVLKLSKLSALTPTNQSFIFEPTIGLNTPFAKLKVPVRKAKQEASISGGVIFAKSTIVGNYV